MHDQSRQPIRAILLDKDGTLVDFRATWLPAIERATHALCVDVGVAEGEAARLLELGGYDRSRGVWDPRSLVACGTTRELAEVWNDALGLGDPVRIEAFLELAFDRDVRDTPVAVAGLAEVLGRLRARGMTLGVATMDTERGAQATLQRLGIDDLFSFVCGYDSGHGHKPGAGMVDAFCARVAIEPGETAVVGDTRHDCEMGTNAGVALVVGVLSGAAGRDALAPHCHHVLDSIANLESVL